MLNELDAYVCSRCCSRRALFSGVAGYGRPVGRGGGGELVGQEQGRLAWLISGMSSLVRGGLTPGRLFGGMVAVLGALAASPYALFKGLSAGGVG